MGFCHFSRLLCATSVNVLGYTHTNNRTPTKRITDYSSWRLAIFSREKYQIATVLLMHSSRTIRIPYTVCDVMWDAYDMKRKFRVCYEALHAQNSKNGFTVYQTSHVNRKNASLRNAGTRQINSWDNTGHTHTNYIINEAWSFTMWTWKTKK